MVFDTSSAAGAYRFRRMGADSIAVAESDLLLMDARFEHLSDGGDPRCLVLVSSSFVTLHADNLLW